MNILSLFDGISCGQVALNRAGIHIDNYFASEIDQNAIKVCQKNFPDTIQLGDIRFLDINSLPHIDIILAGSPCQGFSIAGLNKNFGDHRSGLISYFFEILSKIHPQYFILENVNMFWMYRDSISKSLGKIYPECVTQHEIFEPGKLEPISINSFLVSAQIRSRLYWTNIQNITLPSDKNIMLEDILEDGEGFVCINNTIFNRKFKSTCIDANYYKGLDNHGQRTCVVGYSSKRSNHFGHRVYDSRFKAPTLLSSMGGGNQLKVNVGDLKWRKLTPLECERLQTLPDNYTSGIATSNRYKSIGNGFTVDVIAHILSFI